MELNITELRDKRRPLWMSDLGVDSYADFLGGGGDIYTDRLPPDWERHTGVELNDEEFRQMGGEIHGDIQGQEGFQGQPQGLGAEISAKADVDVNVSGVAETVEGVVETATGLVGEVGNKVTDTVAGAAGALGGVLKGATKKAKNATKSKKK